VRPFVRRCAAMVAPLNIARGTQNKILEAMAMGVPVVTSRIAAGGVDAIEQEHFLVAQKPDEYSAAVLRILDDPTERSRLARAGRDRVLRHHAWSHSMQRLDTLIGRCLSQHARAH
jgi:glycosyltransferase involved in cell wall biosynthesis